MLQRIRDLIEHGATFDSALEEVRRTTVFTTHTPVPAGHDAFPFQSGRDSTSPAAWGTLGRLPRRVPGARPLRQRQRPAVQHDRAGAAHRRLRQRRQPAARRGDAQHVATDLARGVAASERPVRAITNGVHVPTWMSSDMRALLRRAPRVRTGSSVTTIRRSGQRVLEIPDEELWRVRQRAARRTCSPSSASGRASAGRRSASAPRASSPPARCSIPNALTIGFARRFTGYKRPELIFRDADRLAAILTARADRPVQIVFAGKAHPADETGKHHLQQVYRHAHRSEVRRPHRVRRRLRPARRALPRAGLRRLAEQSAQAARSERHERHEGVDQRRAAPEHRRRLVGRGLHRRRTAG